MRYIKEIRWLIQLSEGQKKGIVLPILISAVGVLFSILFVNQTRLIVDNIDAPVSTIISLIFLLICTRLIQFVCEEYESFLRGRLCAKLENAYSLKTFTILFNSNSRNVRNMHSADEMSRLTTDVGIVTECVSNTIPTLILAFIQLISTSVYLIFIQPSLTLLILCVMPIMLGIGHIYSKRIIPVSRDLRKADSDLSGLMQENIQKHEIINSFGVSDFIISNVKRAQSKVFTIIAKRLKYEIFSEAFIDFGFVIGYVAVLIWGVYGIRNGTFTYALLLVFLQLVGQLERPFILFKSNYPSLLNSFASVERIMELEDMEHESRDEIKLDSPIGIEINRMTFAYSESSSNVYKNFSHTFRPKTITAIVGATGAGKSTLFGLILAHLKPQSGSISIFSSRQKVEVSPGTRCNFTIVPQGNTLFSGSVRYNLSIGNLTANDEDMKTALHNAAADFVFDDLPNGLDTDIGENGYGLSEGQAQRIAIARGLLHDGGVLLLDEPTSALDPETESLLLSRLVSRSSDKTIIIISHKSEINKYVHYVIKIGNE
ncbi:MAG: ABC transporter ATP-binding protein/permease [Paramuribaculum sp.]|nr:ABC transporter ATP-binding protein/permease [Paramuribaculum sp.]